MKEVHHSLIEKFLSIYNPNLRYLKKELISLEENYALAFFALPETNVFAANGQRSDHVTESESQLMITQMMWPFFAELLAEKGMGDLRLSYDQFFTIAKQGIFLTEETKKYRNFIDARYGLEGKISLVEVVKKKSKDNNSLWFTKVRTELYPLPEQRKHDNYNSFEATLILKPGIILEPGSYG